MEQKHRRPTDYCQAMQVDPFCKLDSNNMGRPSINGTTSCKESSDSVPSIVNNKGDEQYRYVWSTFRSTFCYLMEHRAWNMRSFKARIQEKFDARPQYDYKNQYHPRVAKDVVEFSCLKRGERVLDLACGTGLATFEAARHVVTGTVTGLDLTLTMLHQAEEEMIAGNVDNVVFQLGDFDEVEFLPCSFDAILMASGSTYVTDFKAFAARAYHWLKPGGRLVYNTPRVPFSPLIELIRGLVAPYGVDIQDPAQAMGLPQWRSVLEAAGFNSIEVIQQVEILTGEPIKRKDYPDFGWWLCNEIFEPQFNLKSALGTQRLGEIKAVFLKEAERIGSKLKGSENIVVDEHDMLFVKAVKAI